MNAATFQKYRDLVHEAAGIDLQDGKEPLVEARIANRLQVLDLRNAEDYLAYLVQDDTGREVMLFLDAITTNYTLFFRNPEQFDLLQREVRRLVSEGRTRLRLWSAGCATGEEPYSMAVAGLDGCGDRDIDLKVLATDISTTALEEARSGVYAAERLAGMPALRRTRYFDHQGTPGDSTYEVKPDVRNRVVFRRLNLARSPFPIHGSLDVIFCRHVMIYFGDSVRRKLIAELERLLRPGGLLVLSRTEGLHGVRSTLESVGATAYRKRKGDI